MGVGKTINYREPHRLKVEWKMAERIVKVQDWSKLPKILKPGIIYDVNGVRIKPRISMDRDLAREIALGIKEMVEGN